MQVAKIRQSLTLWMLCAGDAFFGFTTVCAELLGYDQACWAFPMRTCVGIDSAIDYAARKATNSIKTIIMLVFRANGATDRFVTQYVNTVMESLC